MSPKDLARYRMDVLAKCFSELSYREREVIKLLSGVGDGFTYTNKQVAYIFKTTPREIARIQKSVMPRLQKILSREKLTAAPVAGSPVLVKDGPTIDVIIALPEFYDESFVVEKIVGLVNALSQMYKCSGGSGLVVDDERSGAGTVVVEGAPA